MAGGPRSFRQLCLQTADASIRVSRELCSYCTFSRRVLRAAAAAWMAYHEIDAPARFDVAEVYTDGNHRPVRLEYLEDAFQ